MREERLEVHPFEELRIEHYEGMKQINEHAYSKIEGYIPFSKKDEYIEMGKRQVWVQVIAASGDMRRILFCGVISEMRLEVKNGTCKMELVLQSGTSLMDWRKRTRSFQEAGYTYDYLLDICQKDYEDASRIVTEGKEKQIGNFLMQYKETDWEFIKRLASMNHTIVIADCAVKGEKFYFGLPNRQKTIQGDNIEYRMMFDAEDYWGKREKEIDLTASDAVTYVWESREIHDLGEWGIFDGQQLFVWKVNTKMKGNTLFHTYFLKTRAGFQIPTKYHENISGISLMGKVLDVKEEKVQIEIAEDENKAKAGRTWFTYSTVYSSQDGTGWYCMPEIGDRVRLYFPTDREQDAYIASAYHEEDAELRKRPACKSWRNKEGKEIRLSPEKILLTNNHGTFVEMSDGGGINIVSSGSVSIKAGESLRIASEQSAVEISALRSLKLKQGKIEMNLDGGLSMSGTRIRL